MYMCIYIYIHTYIYYTYISCILYNYIYGGFRKWDPQKCLVYNGKPYEKDDLGVPPFQENLHILSGWCFQPL